MTRRPLTAIEACSRADALRDVASSLVRAEAVRAIGLPPIGPDVDELQQRMTEMLVCFGRDLGFEMPLAETLLPQRQTR